MFMPHWQAPERPKPQPTLATFALHCHEAAALQKARAYVANQCNLDPADIYNAHNTTFKLLEGLLISTQTGEVPDVPIERESCFAYLTYIEGLIVQGQKEIDHKNNQE
jgi:hypothetical protein